MNIIGTCQSTDANPPIADDRWVRRYRVKPSARNWRDSLSIGSGLKSRGLKSRDQIHHLVYACCHSLCCGENPPQKATPIFYEIYIQTAPSPERDCCGTFQARVTIDTIQSRVSAVLKLGTQTLLSTLDDPITNRHVDFQVTAAKP
jgi:hypothetical protein